MKRLLYSLVAGSALVATTNAQDTAPRQDRQEDQQERRQDRPAVKNDRRDDVSTERRDSAPQDRRDDVRSDDRRDNSRNDDRRDNVRNERTDDRRDNVRNDDRRDDVRNDRRDNVPTERRDNVRTERRDDVQTERRNDRRDDVQTERRDDRRDDVRTERRDDVRTERRDNAQARELRGRVVRTGEGQFVVQTPDNRQVTVYTNQRTRYLQNNQPAQFSTLRVGSTVNFGYAMEGERYIADTVTLVPAGAAATTTTEQVAPPARAQEVPAQPAPAQPAPAQGTVVQGEVARVIGQDQVVIRTADGKEVIVYVSPQTTYQLNPQQPGTFADLRQGAPIAVDYNAVNQRNTARRFFAPRRDR